MMVITTRIPFDSEYTSLLGQAIYMFAYYEWTIICIIGHFDKGFVHRYSRGRPLTSRNVCEAFKKLNIADPDLYKDVQSIIKTFNMQIEKRNALIHAHPCTSEGGMQVLNYQTQSCKQYHDYLWSTGDLVAFINAIDTAESQAAELFDTLRKNQNDNQFS